MAAVVSPEASRGLTLPTYPPIAPDAVQLLIICWVFTPLAIIAVGLRLWARRINRQKLVFNDWAIIAALVSNCGQTALLTYACVTAGVGHHIWDLSEHWPGTIPRLLKCYFAAEPFWVGTNSLVKVSILDFYVKVFSTAKTFKKACYGIMAIVAAYWVSTFVRSFFLCSPLAAMWNPTLLTTVPGAYCLDLRAVYLSVSIINQVIDFTLVVLPWPLVWQLHLPMKKKLVLTGIFGLGFFICAVTGLRIKSVLELDFADVSYTVTSDGIWSTLEPCLGLVNACLPLLQPLVQKMKASINWSLTRSKTIHGSLKGIHASSGHHGSEIRAPRRGPTDSKRHRPFVPLTEELWDSEEAHGNWTYEPMPMGSMHRSTVHNLAGNKNDVEANRIQVTKEWQIQHREIW